MTYKGYEATIGLEIHVELKTAQKAFCTCSAEYGGEVNSKCCPVCLGMPGALPVLNPEAVELAVKAGLALGCEISEVSRFDRKHYFYPDLPKGYQITQFYDPVCRNGGVKISTADGEKNVRIRQIHLEEDAGKLSYVGDLLVIDHNRCGVPLIEIVTEPDMKTPREAMALVDKLRGMLLFAGVSDCKMNEGSLRCDVNVSVKKEGDSTPGTRCEIKNINSVNFIGKAIEGEVIRQVEHILAGGVVAVETRRFSEDTCTTERMRDKESEADYRYFREPDIPPVLVKREYVEKLRASLPEMPEARVNRLCSLGVKREHAELICAEPASAEYFDKVIENGGDASASASLFISEILPKAEKEATASPKALAECSRMYLSGEVNIGQARRLLSLAAGRETPVGELAKAHGLYVIRDTDELKGLVERAAEECGSAVREIKRGKLTAKKVIVGYVMKLSQGRADPVLVNEQVDAFFS